MNNPRIKTIVGRSFYGASDGAKPFIANSVLYGTRRQVAAGAGLIASTSTASRQLQFSLKLIF